MEQAPKRKGSRQLILDFFLANIGRVIEGEELRQISGNVSEWGRRVRELRDEEGYQILTHRDRADLKPGQYLLETDKRVPAFARSISKETRAYVSKETAIPVRCVAWRQVTVILLTQIVQCVSQLVTSLINPKVVKIYPTIFVLFVRTAMKACKTHHHPNPIVFTCLRKFVGRR